MRIIADIPDYEIGGIVTWPEDNRVGRKPQEAGECTIKAIGIWYNGGKPKVTFYGDDTRVNMTDTVKVIVEDSHPTYTK